MQKVKLFLQRTWSYWMMLVLILLLMSNYQIRVGWDYIRIDNRAFFKGFDAGETYGAKNGFEKGYEFGSYNHGAIQSDVLMELEGMNIHDILLEEGIIIQ